MRVRSTRLVAVVRFYFIKFSFFETSRGPARRQSPSTNVLFVFRFLKQYRNNRRSDFSAIETRDRCRPECECLFTDLFRLFRFFRVRRRRLVKFAFAPRRVCRCFHRFSPLLPPDIHGTYQRHDVLKNITVGGLRPTSIVVYYHLIRFWFRILFLRDSRTGFR